MITTGREGDSEIILKLESWSKNLSTRLKTSAKSKHRWANWMRFPSSDTIIRPNCIIKQTMLLTLRGLPSLQTQKRTSTPKCAIIHNVTAFPDTGHSQDYLESTSYLHFLTLDGPAKALQHKHTHLSDPAWLYKATDGCWTSLWRPIAFVIRRKN